MPEHPASESSYVAAFAEKWLEVKDGSVRLYDGKSEKKVDSDPWNALEEFCGNNWVFGFLGYDLKNSIWDRLNTLNSELYEAPDLYMMVPSILLKVTGDDIETIIGDISDFNYSYKLEANENTVAVNNFRPGIEKEEYIRIVNVIKEQIKEGDFYEMNFTYPLLADFTGNPFHLYQQMKAINPVPFGAYAEIGELTICCASPERFLKKTGNRLISEPIKGTTARSKSEKEDQSLKEALLSEKNRAENLMIVDLVRHDMSQVCKTGTVKVDKLYEIQSFGTVHQLISRITGELDDKNTGIDALKSCFPMGSMTGAPKLRVMQEIERHEDYKRGIYSGSVGYFNPEGDFDFNVVIRSAFIENKNVVYPVGGAITSDSDPEEEWNETIIKAKSITEAASDRSMK